jgi:glycosyltransferase involved in cell wall biosynthesis
VTAAGSRATPPAARALDHQDGAAHGRLSLTRVLMLIDACRVTGPAKGILQLCEAARGRFEPRLAVFERVGRDAGELRDACAQQALAVTILRERRRFDPSPLLAAWRLAREWRPDVLQTHGYKPTVVARTLARALGVPWIAFSHGVTAESVAVRLYHRLDERLMRAADRVVVVSDAMRRRLVARGFSADRMVTVPNAVSLPSEPGPDAGMAARRSLDVAADSPVVAAIGRLSPEKGQRFLIAAVAGMLREVPGIVTLIAGDGPDEASLRAQAASLPGGCVRVLGHRADVDVIYAAADVIVLPSLSEGSPNVALEAMAHARPLVASAVGGVPEAVEDGTTGVLVPPADPAALARAVVSLLREPAHGAALGIAGRARVAARFSVAARAVRILSLYDDLRPV